MKKDFPPQNPIIGRRYSGKIDGLPVSLRVGFATPERTKGQTIATIVNGVKTVVGAARDVATAARFTTQEARFHTSLKSESLAQIYDIPQQGRREVKIVPISLAPALQYALRAQAHAISDPGHLDQIALVVPSQKANIF